MDNMRLEIKRIEISNNVRSSNVVGLVAIDNNMRASQMEGQLHELGDELHRAKTHIMSLAAQIQSEQSISHSRLRLIQEK
jgi:hypothetical protein